MLDVSVQHNLLKNTPYKRIIGIDEVGRGAWAGPVCVGGFVWTPDLEVPPVKDSKLLTASKRQEIAAALSKQNLIIKSAKAELIDSFGITNVISKMVLDIIQELNTPETLFVVDGKFKQINLENVFQAFKADNTYVAVALAATAAKVYRDSLMENFSHDFSGYGWETNKGYGTKAHALAISELGMTDLHRKSFVPDWCLKKV